MLGRVSAGFLLTAAFLLVTPATSDAGCDESCHVAWTSDGDVVGYYCVNDGTWACSTNGYSCSMVDCPTLVLQTRSGDPVASGELCELRPGPAT